MDEGSKRMLQDIVAKEVSALTEYDIAILRARKFYLSEGEAKKFAEVLEEEEKVVSYSEMTVKALKELCAEKGIDIPVEVTLKAEIIKLLEAVPAE